MKLLYVSYLFPIKSSGNQSTLKFWLSAIRNYHQVTSIIHPTTNHKSPISLLQYFERLRLFGLLKHQACNRA